MRSLLDGPPPALPGPLDRLLEAWAMARPRVRVAVCLALTVGVVLVQGLHLAGVQARWGGDPVAVWQATRTVPAGVDPRGSLERVRLPSATIPETAVTERIGTGETLALPLAEGGILTSIHLSRAGPAVALAADERLVPIPVERSWGIEAGSIVDVWAVDGTVAVPKPLATGRRVLQLRDDGPQPVALVSVDARDVAATTVSLARGRVLLTHVGG